jgi:hypothetical protein
MRDLKDSAIRAAWILGLLLAGWLLWSLTEGPRDRELGRRVNRILVTRAEAFTLGATPVKNRRSLPLGTEFTLRSPEGGPVQGSFLVFPLVSGGTALSCGALIDSQGRVERLIPLGTHAEQIFERIPVGILNVYIRRIEGGRSDEP